MSKRARILVVDSDLHALSRIYLSLIHKDYRVEAADDGGEVLMRAERFKPSVLILNMTSRNLSEEIFSQLNRKRFPVLLINPMDEPVPLPEWKVEQLPYPVDTVVLEEKLKEYISIVDM